MAGKKSKLTVEERLIAKRTISPTGCWEWTGGTRPNGYVNFWVDGKSFLLHRLAYELWVGEIGDALVLHKCDNRKCFNPDDLFLGSDDDNKQDMMVKKRQATGTRNGAVKLNPTLVEEIRNCYSSGEFQWKIAERFSVSQTNVSMIIRGKTWKDSL